MAGWIVVCRLSGRIGVTKQGFAAAYKQLASGSEFPPEARHLGDDEGVNYPTSNRGCFPRYSGYPLSLGYRCRGHGKL